MIVISSVCELAASKGGGSDQYLQSLLAALEITQMRGDTRHTTQTLERY